MLKEIRQYINKHGLFRGSSRVLTAVSGGADSVSMLHILYSLKSELRVDLAVAHLNHGTRGRDSDEDEQFVKDLARRLDLEFISAKKNVPRMADSKGISLEMAAREARYAFFAKAADKLDCAVVVTAHTANDQAETVILNLARGAGLQGLGGTHREINLNNTRIARPMLCVTRKDIIRYLKRNGFEWREDKSNRDLSFLRNRVRHDILPTLEKYLNPSINETLVRTAEILSAEDEWLDRETELLLDECLDRKKLTVDCEELARFSVAQKRRILMRVCDISGVPPEQMNFDAVVRMINLTKSASGSAHVNITGEWIAVREYCKLKIQRVSGQADEQAYSFSVKRRGETVHTDACLKAVCSIKPGLIKGKCRRAGELPAAASLSLAAAGRKKIYLRSPRPGDKFSPFGMKGTKKVQDILVDEKVPRAARCRIPVLECGGEIIWIPGFRVGRGWEVKDPSSPSLQITVTRI